MSSGIMGIVLRRQMSSWPTGSFKTSSPSFNAMLDIYIVEVLFKMIRNTSSCFLYLGFLFI
ncbi:hypothetical protein NC653_011442 [Populus alba x Populus x berolinensis]|uniref:Uncharacterized protein n=1 Tax=Populus alba x Populus x berolinensis TaxID=444605 RepID=A0AAD6R2A4_9ROSI|nr:hypothetical protein NC653_011442 [Populus alba x Populus x berolinensis]